MAFGKRNISRRGFAVGSAAALGAGMAAIALSSCSSDGGSQPTGEPQVVTDDSQIIAVLDGDYKSADNPYEPAYTWTLPLGTVLYHCGGSWAAAMLAPESSAHVNTLGILSLATGGLKTLIEAPTQGAGYDFFDVRCSDGVYAWVEINYTDRSWVLAAQSLSNGSLAGDPVKLDSGDVDWEPPRFTATGSSVIWQKMPLATGGASSEDSHCYRWSTGDEEGVELWTSTGRFATSPRVSDGILTIVPRVRNDEGVYYGMTALDLSDENLTRVDQLVLPRTVAPFEAVYGLIFGQIGQREQAAVEVGAVSIVFVQPVRRELRVQIRSRFPGKGVETAAANQRAGRAHAGFPFRPLPVAFTILKSERNFGAMHRAFEEVARQGCAVHNTA